MEAPDYQRPYEPVEPPEGGGRRLAGALVAALILVLAFNLVEGVQWPAESAPEPVPEAALPPPARPLSPAPSPSVAPESQVGPQASLMGMPPQVIRVSLSDDFALVDWKLPASSTPQNVALSSSPPAGAKRSPEGRVLRYGELKLGPGGGRRYAFVMDLGTRGGLLWLDRNHNGDFTDDGEPLPNQGKGAFATAIEIPMRELYPEQRGERSFVIWLYVDRQGLERSRAGAYSRTQAQGRVFLDGIPHAAWIVDQGINDADLTNDGIYVDLDRNGQVDPETERIGPDQGVWVAGRPTRFEVGP
jgi:hypothetical protein